MPPELIEEHRSRQKVGAGRRRRPVRGARPVAACRRRPTLHYDTIFTWTQLDAWLARLEAAAAGRARHRDRFARRDAGARSSASRSASSRARRPTSRCAHNYAGAPDQLPRDEVLARLKPWLEDPDEAEARASTSSTTATCSPTTASTVRGYAHDTMLQSYVLEAHKPHGLASLAERHLGRSGIDYEDVARQGRAPDPVRAGRRSTRAAEYSCEDCRHDAATCTRRCGRSCEADAKLRFIYDAIEMPAARRC